MTKFFFIFLILTNYIYSNENIDFLKLRGVNIPIDILRHEPSIISELSEKKINAVRIHIDYIKYMKTYTYDYETSIRKSLEDIKKILNEINKYKMTSFLGIENFPYRNKICKNKLKKEYWESKECINNMINLAKIISNHFSYRSKELLGYQFMSEAVYLEDGKSLLPQKWENIQSELLKTVRKNDKNHFFIYSPTLWALSNKFDEVKPLQDTKIIYNAHFFYPFDYTHQGIKENEYGTDYPSFINFRFWNKKLLKDKLKNFIDFRDKYNVPILIGSFSKMNWIKDDNRWLRDILNVFEENQISWLYFIVGERPWKGWDPRYVGNYQENVFKKNVENETWKILKEYFKLNNKDNDEN